MPQKEESTQDEIKVGNASPSRLYAAVAMAKSEAHRARYTMRLSRPQMLYGPREPVHRRGDDYSSAAPSAGSSAVSIFESRFMLMAWTSAIRCLNRVASTSSSTSRYRKVPSSVTS